jgi:hypothetical protein
MRWLALVACAACGDNIAQRDDLFAPVSGGRIALQKYRYDDGTELAVSTEFYDLQLHTRCSPQRWPDGALRCVPVADDAVYRDAGCSQLIGVARAIAEPTLFLVHDTLPAGRVVARVVRAGAAASPIAQFWETAGGACVGPTPIAPGATFFDVGDEVAPDAQAAFHDHEVGGGRLGLQIRETDDGLRVLAGLRDRELDAACVATVEGDGGAACEPSDAAPASLYRDPGCGEPVVASAAPVAPRFARLADPSGCARYYRVGDEMSPPIFRRDGDACMPADAPVGGRLYALAEPVELAALGRAREVAGRRLERVVLDPGVDPGSAGPQFYDDRLFDTALGADCRPRIVRGAIRCFPANAPTTPTLFFEGCAVAAAVAELPQHSCEPLAFATSNRPFQIRPIGDPSAAKLFRLDSGGVCQPYTSAPGTELRTLGAPIDPATFPLAIYFGERAP